MPRKTMNVEALRKQVNEMLADSTCDADQRVGMCQVLESALHATGNYNGFGYLLSHAVPQGYKPGINEVRDEDLEDPTDSNELYVKRFCNTDDSRRHYY